MDFFPYNADAAIELVDSLSTNLQAKSPVELSLNPCYSRHYSSLPHVIGGYYKSRETSIEESRKALDNANEKIQHSLCQNIGVDSGAEYHLFAIDVTPNKRPYAKKLADKGFVHINETVTGKKPVAIGHKYSCIAYITQEKHWALPLSLNRVKTSEKDTVYGVTQWCSIIKDPSNGFGNKKSIGLFDSAYSNAFSITQLILQTKGIEDKVIFIARLRGDRVLMRPAHQVLTGRKGRPAFFDMGRPFRLDDATTWEKPQNSTTVPWVTSRKKEHTVEINVWTDLRMRGHRECPIQTVPLTVIRIAVKHQKDGSKVYQHPLWLVIVGTWPDHWPISLFWTLYCARFDIEHLFRFAKQRLLMDVYQTPECAHEENWMQFVMLAYHQLFHARSLAKNLPRPWEKKVTINNSALSPSRVQRDMSRVLSHLPVIITPVKPRGIPAGRKTGEIISSRVSIPVVCKSASKPAPLPQARIILRFKQGGGYHKPRIKYEGLDQAAVPAEILTIIKNLEEVSPLPIPPPS